MSEARCIWQAKALLGEGPLWCPVDFVLYWIDIKGCAIHRCLEDGQGRQTIKLQEEIGCLALRQQGGMIAALRSSIALLDNDFGAPGNIKAPKIIAAPEADQPFNRLNDGKCDRLGRLFVGAMDDREKNPTGGLYRLSANWQINKILSGIVIANGLGFSPDDQIMYFTDSVNRTILAFDYDLQSGEAENQRVFVRVAEDAGFPDGLTVDAEGYVWSANWDGWRITRYDPSGAIDQTISLPVPRPTSCMFGGHDLKRLFVTSAAIGLDRRQLAKAPLSGGLFAIDLEASGLPEPRFAG